MYDFMLFKYYIIFWKTLRNGSKRNFGSFRLFGFAKSSNFKDRVQQSETLSSPLTKCRSLIYELVLISLIRCIIYTGKRLFSLRIYFKTVFESVQK